MGQLALAGSAMDKPDPGGPHAMPFHAHRREHEHHLQQV
jgi:hypothetical protein